MPADFQTVQLNAGAVLFREDDDGDFAYAIVDGEVDVLIARPDGPIRVATLGPGELIGEMAIIGDCRRTATARARSDCTLQRIAPDQFRRRLAAMDPVMRLTVATILRRLTSTLQQLDAVTGTAAPATAPDSGTAIAHLRLENEIRAAIGNREFALHFQPVVDLATGRLAGFEGLMRWRHPVEGLIPPARFVPVAEETGLIVELTEIAIADACAVLPELRIAGLANCENVDRLFVSANVTARDIDCDDFPGRCRRHLVASGLDGEALKLEITESSLMTDLDRAGHVLAALRGFGVGVAIDDFGTGYSSLSHLARLPISTLKIDRSFVSAMLESAPDRTVTEVIVGLGKDLDLPIVAEGIETPGQFAALAASGCAFGQGYLFARPMPVGEAIETVRRWQASDVLALAQTAERFQAAHPMTYSAGSSR